MASFVNRCVIAAAAVVLFAGAGASAHAQTPPPAAAPSPAQQFDTTLKQAGGPAKARVMFDAARKKDPKVVLFAENEMNLYGYELLQGGNAKDAVIVFQMNVDAYPKSANVYDSLSDGQLAAGDKAGALKNAEKALALVDKDPSITDEELRGRIKVSAETKIKDLKKP